MSKYFNMDGWVCGKIDTRTTRSGKQVTEFSINSPDRREVDGQWESVPQFFNCVYWHKNDRDWRADAIRDKAHLHIAGTPRYETWEKDGSKRSAVKFNVRDLFPIAGKSETQPSVDPETSVYDHDIPF